MKNTFKITYFSIAFFLCLTSLTESALGQNSFHFEFRDGYYNIYEDSYPKDFREALGINYKYYQNNTYINGKTLAQFLAEEQEKNPDALYLYGGGTMDTIQKLYNKLFIPRSQTMTELIKSNLKLIGGVDNYSIKSYSFIYSQDGILRLFGFNLWDNEDKKVTKQLLTEDQFRAIFNEVRKKVRIDPWNEKILHLYGRGVVRRPCD